RDHLHDARLAGAIRPEQPESLAGLQVERDAVDRPRITTPVALAQVLHADHRRHGLAATIRCVIQLERRQRVTLIWAGLAVVLSGFEGSILILALPAIARDFHAGTTALSGLGSVLALGTLGALPLATLADRFGRRRLIAIGVAGFSLVNFGSAFGPSLADMAFLKLFALCFEVLVLAVGTAL